MKKKILLIYFEIFTFGLGFLFDTKFTINILS